VIPEIERWKRFPPPWRQLGPRMAADGFDGLLLRERRKAAGYSQSGLGYLVGTNQARVSAWELGETMPPSDRLAALAEVLNCRPEDLCRG
jgi:DNA-binding transcriptional regulator YiaG